MVVVGDFSQLLPIEWARERHTTMTILVVGSPDSETGDE